MHLAFLDPVREFFTLRSAERTIRAYAPGQRARVVEHVEAADTRLRAGRQVTDPIAAALLLRDAASHYLFAAACARDAQVSLEGVDLVRALPPLAPDPMRPRAAPTDDERVRDALSSNDILYFDHIGPVDVAHARRALERAATMLRAHIEPRSLVNIRGARWGRFASLVVVLGYVAFAIVRAKVVPKDIALHKPVYASSRKVNPPDGHELVDGEIGTSFAVHTNVEDNANVVIDLQSLYWVDTVKVYNRVDGWFDDSLPLAVDFSQDGVKWDEVARRDEHFGTSPPWIVHAGGKAAHFVRLRVARRGYLALSEVEVFGKKF